jgi:VanZ family protein
LLRLRYPLLWAALGWLLVAGVVMGSLLPGRIVAAVTFNDKIEHAGAYALLMLWFGGLYPRARHPWIAVALLALGIALDLLQGLTETRSLEALDILADAVGLAIGLSLSMTVLEGWCQRLERRLLT